MKKVYNVLLIILIILGIIVLILIGIKYGKNQINEKNIKEKVSEIEENLQKNNNQSLATEYKGYKIEGIIEIPKINIKYPILSETNVNTMKISITKFWGPNVNDIGNYTMAGHNNRDGTMFGKTKYLSVNDTIKMTDLNNNTIEYKIFKIYKINPDDVSCTNSIDNNAREVTLITCTNGHKERLIIKARE